MIYDVIIVWAGAAWLFAWINLDKNLSKLILEKTDKPWIKVLLSWWERANVSNVDIEVERDYFGQNKKALISIFARFNQWDIMSYFSENWVNIVEEDRWRLILESWDSKELLDVLLKWIKNNWCELKINSDVVWVEKKEDFYEIKVSNWIKYQAKNVIVSSWWKSFFHVWTTWEWYNFAKSFWIKIVEPYRTLCWMSTKRDLSEVSWISSVVDMKLIDKNSKKDIYTEKWPILFTHFWVSGPIIHNLSNAIWEYLNKITHSVLSDISPSNKGEKKIEIDFENYILNNLSIDLLFDLENSAKRLVKFFELDKSLNPPLTPPLSGRENRTINLELQNWRSWKEAKATGWWVDISELDNNMQSKKYKWLYFIWEVVDITWKTWWFNLQWAWSSGFIAGKSIKKD